MRINWITRKSNVWVAVTTQLPLTHIQCTLSLVTTEFAKSFICQQSLFTSSSIFVTNPIREARFSESLIDYHFSSHGLIKLPLDQFSAENEWLPCWLVRKKKPKTTMKRKEQRFLAMGFVLLNQRNRGRKEKWKQKGNNNRRPWQLYAATMRKSKYNLKPTGSFVNRGRLNCKKNDEKKKGHGDLYYYRPKQRKNRFLPILWMIVSNPIDSLLRSRF